MARIARGEQTVIDPSLQNGRFFIDKLFQLGLQKIADMRCAGQNLIGEKP